MKRILIDMDGVIADVYTITKLLKDRNWKTLS